MTLICWAASRTCWSSLLRNGLRLSLLVLATMAINFSKKGKHETPPPQSKFKFKLCVCQCADRDLIL